MNVYTIKLDPIDIRPDHTCHILHAIIHTILLQRTIGIPIIPKEVHSPIFDDLIYTIIDDKVILDKVETKIRTITKNMEQQKKGRIYLSLCSDTTKYGFMGKYTEHIEWERWYIDFSFSTTTTPLEKYMNSIIEHCTVPPQHIPTTNFFFDIIDTNASSMFDMITPFFT